MPDNKTINEIPIKDLAKGVLLSGKLTDIHINSLKTYPFIVFDNVELAETNYDINTNRDQEQHAPSVVEYRIEFKKGTRQLNKQEAKKRVKYLVDAISGLLWSGIEVKVFNKKTGKQIGE